MNTSTSLEHSRAVAELDQLARLLNQSGYTFSLNEPQAHLIAHIALDDDSETHVLTISLLPLASIGEGTIRLIGFDIERRLTIRSEQLSDVIAALAALSEKLPIGVLHLAEDSSLHLTYTLAVDALAALPSDVVVDVMQLLDRLCAQASGYIQHLVEGEIELSTVIHTLSALEEL